METNYHFPFEITGRIMAQFFSFLG